MITLVADLIASQPLEVFGSQMYSSNSMAWFCWRSLLCHNPLPILRFLNSPTTRKRASSLKILKCGSPAYYLIHVWVNFEKRCSIQSIFFSLNKLSARTSISKIVHRRVALRILFRSLWSALIWDISWSLLETISDLIPFLDSNRN